MTKLNMTFGEVRDELGLSRYLIEKLERQGALKPWRPAGPGGNKLYPSKDVLRVKERLAGTCGNS